MDSRGHQPTVTQKFRCDPAGVEQFIITLPSMGFTHGYPGDTASRLENLGGVKMHPWQRATPLAYP